MHRSFLFILILIGLHSSAQQPRSADPDTATIRANVKADAHLSARYLLAKQYDSFVHYIHPVLVEQMGGKNKALQILKEATSNELSAKGVTIDSVHIGEPGPIISYKGQLQCVIHRDIFMTINGKRIRADGNGVACSFNKGKNWFFVDLTGNVQENEQQKKNLRISEDLVLPAWRRPVEF